MMQAIRTLALVFGLLVGTVYLAAQPVMAAQHAAELSEGEVRKIDKETGKMTLRHGPLANLDMPAMTMVFQVSDKAMLDQVKVGDKVRFQAEKIGSQYTVTKIEAAQ
jgi:Cu(I)/Ag(I) efflux system periplasmic protein CusF